MVYRPVEVKAVQWARVHKLISAAGIRGIAVSELAVRLGLGSVTPELEKSLSLLRRQGRIRESIGKGPNGHPCHFVQSVDVDLRARDFE